MAEKNLVEAERYLDRLRVLDNGNLIALQGLAQLAFSQGDKDRAISLLEEGRAGHPDTVAIRLSLARIYLAQGETNEVNTLVGELLALAPEKPEVLAVAGDVALATGRARDALEHYKRWTGVQPGVAESYFGEARAYLGLSENEAARRALDKAAALKPNWIPAATALALLDLKEGRTEEALAIAVGLEKANSTSAAPSILKGDILMRTGDYAKAVAAYRKAFELEPGTPVAIRAYQAAVQAGESMPQRGLESWLEKNPQDYAAGLTLAEYYQRVGDDAYAIRVYEQVLASRPDDAATLNNMAWALHQTGDPKAEQYARRAYAQRQDVASISDTLGWILVSNGQLEEGVKLLKAAANGAPNNREIQYHLAVGLANSGKAAESRTILERILAEPENKNWEGDARRLLETL